MGCLASSPRAVQKVPETDEIVPSDDEDALKAIPMVRANDPTAYQVERHRFRPFISEVVGIQHFNEHHVACSERGEVLPRLFYTGCAQKNVTDEVTPYPNRLLIVVPHGCTPHASCITALATYSASTPTKANLLISLDTSGRICFWRELAAEGSIVVPALHIETKHLFNETAAADQHETVHRFKPEDNGNNRKHSEDLIHKAPKSLHKKLGTQAALEACMGTSHGVSDGGECAFIAVGGVRGEVGVAVCVVAMKGVMAGLEGETRGGVLAERFFVVHEHASTAIVFLAGCTVKTTTSLGRPAWDDLQLAGRIASASADCGVHIWDISDGVSLHTLATPFAGRVRQLAVSPASTSLVAIEETGITCWTGLCNEAGPKKKCSISTKGLGGGASQTLRGGAFVDEGHGM